MVNKNEYIKLRIQASHDDTSVTFDARVRGRNQGGRQGWGGMYAALWCGLMCNKLK